MDPKEKPYEFVVRLPTVLRNQIADAAKYYRRSMNSEIVARLERTFSGRRLEGRFEEIATRLVVLSPAEVKTEIEDCLALGAPEAIGAELVRGNKLPFLMEDPRNYLGHESYPWDEVLYPVNRVGQWCVAVIPNPPTDIDFDPAISSYDTYLAQKI